MECYNPAYRGDQAAHSPLKSTTRSPCFQVIIPIGSGPRPQPSRRDDPFESYRNPEMVEWVQGDIFEEGPPSESFPPVTSCRAWTNP
jgi:hypothetical protein